MLTGKRPLGFTFPVNTSARPLPPSSPGGNTCRTALALCTTEASVWTRPLSTTTTSGVPVSATASTSSCCTPVRSRDVASFPSPEVAGRKMPLRPATTTTATSASRATCTASAKPDRSSPSTSQPFAYPTSASFPRAERRPARGETCGVKYGPAIYLPLACGVFIAATSMS